MLGVVHFGTGPPPRVRACAPPVPHVLCDGYKRGLHAFQGGQRHHGRFGTSEEKKGAAGRGEATAGGQVLGKVFWDMLYTDDAGDVTQSSEQSRKMMRVIVVVCTAFGLTVSKIKTDITCLRTKAMPDSTATLSVEVAGQVYNQTNEFVYLGGNVNHSADLSIEVNRHIRNAWCSFRNYTLELYDKPSATLELKIRMLRASRGTRENTVRLCHMEPARVPLRHAAPSPPRLPDSLHRLAKERSSRPPDFLSGYAYEDGK